MTLEAAVSAIATSLIASASLTGIVRKFALAHRLLDVPNDRSSHTTPTPRGGGLAIVITLLAAIVVLGALGTITVRLTVALLGSGGFVAAVGFADDKWQVAAPIRLAVHFACVVDVRLVSRADCLPSTLESQSGISASSGVLWA